MDSRFASNQRSQSDLLEVKSYLQDILETLRGYTASSSTPLMESVLRKIVAFNGQRLQIYVKHISAQTQSCLRTPKLSTELSDKLSELQDLALKAGDQEIEESKCKQTASVSNFSECGQCDETDSPKVFKACTNLMIFIKVLSKSPTYKSLQEKASSGTGSGQPSPWAELRHAAGRLLSYYQASRTLIEARKKWDCLFHDFEIDFVRSSTPISNPVTDRKVNAEAIIGRMTGDGTKMREYRAHAEELQKFDLDGKIKEQAAKSSFKPLVHAEVLIHQSMVDEFGPAGPHSSQYFNGYKYIGSSKPTCRLCDYYFTASATGIEVRKTHRNLYINWRAPDVYSHQGEAAAKRRQQVLNKVCDRVREDTFRTLAEKVPERKKYDSNTDPTFPALNHGTSVGFDGGWRDADPDPDDLAASLGQLGLRDAPWETEELRLESPPFRAGSGFDADDDDGGARLW